MAQLQQFSVQVIGKTFRVAGKVIDDNGVQVGDFTGANDVQFPQVMNSLTDEQVIELGDMLGNWLLLTLAGLET